MEFTTDIEMLAECLKTKKHNILRFLKKNFKENIHYKKDGLHARIELKRGGSNRERILVTEKCCELVKNTYDIRNKYVSEFDDNIIEVSLGLDFNVYKNLVLNTGYSFTTTSSDEANREYDRHILSLGMTAKF